MREYVIITDSTSDLSPELIQELDLKILPLTFTIGGETYINYPDQRDISTKEFYKLSRSGLQTKTTQPSLTDTINLFEETVKQGKDILYISFSSNLSGTFNTASIASREVCQKYPESKIIVVDSLSASLGEGLLVYYASLQKKNGLNIDELAAWVQENRLKFCHWFTVDDLMHLKRSGRVNSTSALVGTMLNIKPVLHTNDEGQLAPVRKVRGRKQALQALVEEMKKTCIEPQNQTIFIGHADCIEDAEYVSQLIKEQIGVKQIVINYVGPVIGGHSGPGTVALFFVGEHR